MCSTASSSSSPTRAPAARNPAAPAGRRLAAALLWLGLVLAEPGLADSNYVGRSDRQCQADLFCVVGIDLGKTVEIRVESLTERALTVAVRPEVRNAAGENGAKSLRLARPGTQTAFRFAVPADESWKVGWDYDYHPGTEPAAHDDSVVYRLPYESGSAFEVIQGYDGGFTHKNAMRFAIDWLMPEGTPVLAARGGIVAGFWDRSDKGGPDPALRGQENFLWIEHDDGTLGQYVHLQKGGVLVEVGQRVEAGDRIALSGNSGYSTRPHLHFHVSTVSNGHHALKTFPLRFRVENGERPGLLFGRSYRAP